MKCGHKEGIPFIYTSVNTSAIAPVCTNFLDYIYNWWYCNVIKLMNKIKVYL